MRWSREQDHYHGQWISYIGPFKTYLTENDQFLMSKLFRFIKPYWLPSTLALVLLALVLFIDLAIPRLIQRIIDDGVRQGNMNIVLQTSAIMIGLSLLQILIALGNNYFSVRVGEAVARDVREALFVRIQSFSYGDIDRFSTGKLMVRLSSDSTAVQRVFQVSLRIGTRAPLLMIGSLILMFNTSRSLALTIMPLLLVAFVVIVVFSIKMEPLFMIVQQKLDRLNTVLQENIAGARLVKAFVRAGREGERFEVTNEEFTQRNVKVMTWMSTMAPVLTFLVNIGIVVVIYTGGLMTLRGTMTEGQIVAFTNYLITTMGPLLLMAPLANVWANGIASARRVNEILDTEPEVQDAPDARPLPQNTRPAVTFDNVSFHYNGSSDGLVLEGIHLQVRPGQMVAILGATGAGKSSLVNLIPRFYDPSGGRILLDGTDIRTIPQDDLLAQIAIVPQETILFSGSVRDNIRYGRPEASDEEVIAAAKAAQAHDFILELPQGYDTHIEERGVNLSGGQKQRIAIARAVITRPAILILDDSTSAVDVETETRIQAALREIMQGRTSFVVAQRISTVLQADKIVVIDRGRIAAEGTHGELMQSSPIYQEIYESQLGSGLRIEAATAGAGWGLQS
jgi:ATP-binding cassette, subfamily B, multidrug efflux pump